MQKHYYDNVGIFESVAKSPNHFVYNLVSTFAPKNCVHNGQVVSILFWGET